MGLADSASTWRRTWWQSLFSTPEEFARSLRDRWKLILVSSAAGAILGLSLAIAIPPVFVAGAELQFVVSTDADQSASMDARRTAVEYAQVATSGQIISDAAHKLSLDPSDVSGRIHAFAVVQAPITWIVASGNSPESAISLATVVATRTQRAFEENMKTYGKGGNASLITTPSSTVRQDSPGLAFFIGAGALFAAWGASFGAVAAGPMRSPRDRMRRSRNT